MNLKDDIPFDNKDHTSDIETDTSGASQNVHRNIKKTIKYIKSESIKPPDKTTSELSTVSIYRER